MKNKPIPNSHGLSEDFENIKKVIRSRKSKDRQHNGQKKTVYKALHIKIKIE